MAGEMALDYGTANVLGQLSAMALGLQSRINAEQIMDAVVEGFVAQGIDAKIGTAGSTLKPFEDAAVNTVADTGLDNVIEGNNISAKQLLVQMIGAEAQAGASLKFEKDEEQKKAQQAQQKNLTEEVKATGFQFGSSLEINPTINNQGGMSATPTTNTTKTSGIKATSQSSLNAGASGQTPPSNARNLSRHGMFNGKQNQPVATQSQHILPDAAGVATAGLAGLGLTAKEFVPNYLNAEEGFTQGYREAYERSMQLVSDDFFNGTGTSSEAAFHAELRAMEYNNSMAGNFGAFATGAKILEHADPLGLAIDTGLAMNDVESSPDPAKTAFVDAAGIAGGYIAGRAAVIGIVTGTVATDGFALPEAAVAMTKVGTVSMMGNAAARLFATGIWDGVAWSVNEVNQPLQNGEQWWNNSFGR